MNLIAYTWSPPTWAGAVLLVVSWLALRALVIYVMSRSPKPNGEK